MRILCVEDEATTLQIYRSALDKSCPDDEIAYVETGSEAQKLICELNWDLVITDLVLPDMTGIDVLSAAKERDPQTEVIIVTGKGSILSAVEAMREGAREYLEKPINIEFLLKKIENTRDYKSRVVDSENFFAAQQLQEESSARTISYLERRIRLLETCQNEITEILENGSSNEERLSEIERKLFEAKQQILKVDY